MASQSAKGKTHLVTFVKDDPEDPVNWPKWKKVSVVMMLCVLAFCSVFGSSSYAPGQQQLERLYGINEIAASSGLTLYVLGFAFGPLIWGPMSEMYGRKVAYMLSWPLMIGAVAPSAFASNIVVILLFRFLTGACAACALNNGSGVITEAIAWYSFCPLSGPCFGSLVGFFVAAATNSGSGLWVVRVHFFFAIACWPLVLLLPETHGPTILSKRAKRLRAEGHENARAAHEIHKESRKQILQKHILRPTQMLLYEPINQGAAIWISLAYGIVYFFFEAYPVVFIAQHNIPFRLCGLLFLPIPIGQFLVVAPYERITRFFSQLPLPGIEKRGVTPQPAEARLKVVLSACLLLPMSLFWFAWTSGPETHWIAPALAGIAFGYSLMAIFMCFLAYVSQTYTVYASSASACNVFVRSIIASAFPVFANSLLSSVGTKWGLSLFGFLSLGLIPIPLFFIRYGEKLRARSKFAQEARKILEQMREGRDGTSEKTQVESDAAELESEAAKGAKAEKREVDSSIEAV